MLELFWLLTLKTPLIQLCNCGDPMLIPVWLLHKSKLSFWWSHPLSLVPLSPLSGISVISLCLSFLTVMSTTASKPYIVLFCFPDDRSQTILPLVKSFCEKSFKADESILISLSFHLGKLCHGLYGTLFGVARLTALLFCPYLFPSTLFGKHLLLSVCSRRRT